MRIFDPLADTVVTILAVTLTSSIEAKLVEIYYLKLIFAHDKFLVRASMRIFDQLAFTGITILVLALTSSIEAKVVEDQEDSVTIKVYYESMCPTSI